MSAVVLEPLSVNRNWVGLSGSRLTDEMHNYCNYRVGSTLCLSTTFTSARDRSQKKAARGKRSD